MTYLLALTTPQATTFALSLSSVPALSGKQNVKAICEDLVSFLQMTPSHIYDPTVMLLDIYRNLLKSYIHTEICTGMFIAASFIIPPKLNTTRFASMHK